MPVEKHGRTTKRYEPNMHVRRARRYRRLGRREPALRRIVSPFTYAHSSTHLTVFANSSAAPNLRDAHQRLDPHVRRAARTASGRRARARGSRSSSRACARSWRRRRASARARRTARHAGRGRARAGGPCSRARPLSPRTRSGRAVCRTAARSVRVGRANAGGGTHGGGARGKYNDAAFVVRPGWRDADEVREREAGEVERAREIHGEREVPEVGSFVEEANGLDSMYEPRPAHTRNFRACWGLNEKQHDSARQNLASARTYRQHERAPELQASNLTTPRTRPESQPSCLL
jgi:hypothetical protein